VQKITITNYKLKATRRTQSKYILLLPFYHHYRTTCIGRKIS